MYLKGEVLNKDHEELARKVWLAYSGERSGIPLSYAERLLTAQEKEQAKKTRMFQIDVVTQAGTKGSYKGLFKTSSDALIDALDKFEQCKIKVVAL